MLDVKQVRVDNWGIFFLQRLQQFFNKTDFCDLTLQFEDNVQLKVHRLVMSACTDFFQILEQTCDVYDDNTIVMPQDLQADVILPIVNFMYTGTLHFERSLYDRLYATARQMNIQVLIKLLEAQRPKSDLDNGDPLSVQPSMPRKFVPKQRNIGTPKGYVQVLKRAREPTASYSGPTIRKPQPYVRKKSSNVTHNIVPLFGGVGASSNSSASMSPGNDFKAPSKYSGSSLSHLDSTPKPTRFEWPEDDLKSLDFMDSTSSFDNISYSSQPLIKEETLPKASIKNVTFVPVPPRTKPPTSLVDEEDPNDPDYEPDGFVATKRKAIKQERPGSLPSVKKVRLNEKENKELHINAPHDMDHSKIISEVLKKYPNLAKSNKSIKLKILTKPDKSSPSSSASSSMAAAVNSSRGHISTIAATASVPSIQYKTRIIKQSEPRVAPAPRIVSAPRATSPAQQDMEDEHAGQHQQTVIEAVDTEGPWVCEECPETLAEPFNMFYLYRRHMTEHHHVLFSKLMCTYCGFLCRTDDALTYHVAITHGQRSRASSRLARMASDYMQCQRCAYMAINRYTLARHMRTHTPDHVQCLQCKLCFVDTAAVINHTQISGHRFIVDPLGRNSYECQYCSNRCFSDGPNLFTHLKLAHLDQGLRDGIANIAEPNDDDLDLDQVRAEEAAAFDGEYVSAEPDADADASDDVKSLAQKRRIVASMESAEDDDDDDAQTGEIEEILVTSAAVDDEVVAKPKKIERKVHILRDVSVPMLTPYNVIPKHQQMSQPQQTVSSHPENESTETDTMVVDTTENLTEIAAKMGGMVVLLDDNQQYIIQTLKKTHEKLVEHTTTRHKPRKIICKYCGKECKTDYQLKIHERRHTGIKPFVCEFCGKGFAQKAPLKTHTKIHNGRNEQCDQCEKTFCRPIDLKIHVQRIHLGIRPEKSFLCNTCGHASETKTQLADHMVSHTNDRKHVCDQCGKSFKLKTTLRKHLDIHTGEKRHKCPVCPYRTNQSGNLKTHAKKHANEAARQAAKSGQRTLTCDHCNRPFSMEKHLLEHIRNTHAIVMDTH